MTGVSVPAAKHANSTTAKRESEGSRQTGAVARTRNLSGEKRSAGRPAGSKNKSKSLVPTELADQMLVKMQGSIPAAHFEYLKKVIKGGDVVSTEKELDILIVLLGRNLHPALIAETFPSEDGIDDDELEPQPHGGALKRTNPVFRKDVTERLKVLNSLLTLRHQIDKSKDEEKDGKQPLLTIVADRNLLDGGRLGILVGAASGPMAGNADGVGRPAVPPRTVSGPLPQ